MRRERKIMEWLERNGPHFRHEIKEGLNVPKEKKDERSFYRSINRLIEYGVLIEQKDGRIAKKGYQQPEKLSISVGPRPLRISVPVPIGTAKRMLDKHLRLKSILLKRKGPAYEVLSELGILD